MKLEDQVLSIEQVRELQELGFDIKKYSSMYFVPNWITKYGIDEIQDYLLTIGELGDDYEGDCIPTMTIGDIIEVLPIRLGDSTFTLGINSSKVEYYSKYFDSYSFEAIEETLIDALFETLKWCIKEKHIEL